MDKCKAEKARELLDLKDKISENISELEQCDAIFGDIVSGCNGRRFRIERDHRYFKYILQGLYHEIDTINLEISRL